jgi:hypothetical protein
MRTRNHHGGKLRVSAEYLQPANFIISSYDHQWTFLREFHVSPFNDRSGFYTVSIKSPSHPPTPTEACLNPPRPAVRIHLRAPSSADPTTPGDLKLTALLRPTTARPLDASSLFFVILRTPFALLLSFPRILFEAWRLHYRKRLDVHIRPEPLPAVPDWGPGVDSSVRGLRSGGGVKWVDEGLLEKYARRRIEYFLDRRVNETGVMVTLVAANPAIEPRVFTPASPSSSPGLTVWYLSPRFFTITFLCPSASHALLLGGESEGVFFTSSPELFTSAFSSPAGTSLNGRMSSRQRLRALPVPKALTLTIPEQHYLDEDRIVSVVLSTVAIRIHHFLELLEAQIFQLARARAVPGEEPWKQWERAEARFRQKETSTGIISSENLL